MATHTTDGTDAKAFESQYGQASGQQDTNPSMTGPEDDGEQSSESSDENHDAETNHTESALLAARLKAMEERMRVLEGPTDDSDSDDLDDIWFPFSARRSLLKNVETIISESTRTIKGLNEVRRKERRIRQEAVGLKPNLEWEAMWQETDCTEKREPLPERILLRSQALKVTFRRVAPEVYLHPDIRVVLLRPYRPLVYYESKLREELHTLEQHEKRSRNAAENHSSASKSYPATIKSPSSQEAVATQEEMVQPISTNPVIATQETAVGPDGKAGTSYEDSLLVFKNPANGLLHLRCLMGFFDSNVRPTLEYLASNECNDIYFHDLWHLFRPGTEIVDQMEKQAYRVFRVQASRHRIEEEPWLRWSQIAGPNNEMEDQSPLKISCAFIDFDGKSFGPVMRTFTIPPFSGLQAVTKLPVYPVRLARNKRLRSELSERGKTLLGVSKFRSMYFTGQTLDSRDEVDSQVVVDFAEALIAREDWTPRFDGLKPKPPGPPKRICTAPCCSGQPVHHDEHVDAALAEDFIKTLVSPDSTKKASSLLLMPRALNDLQPGSSDEPSDEELVVMTYRVFAFVLRSRKWAKLDLALLRAENVDANHATRFAFNQLVLPKGHRDMVKSLVTQHFRARHSAAGSGREDEKFDLVRGKGKGLIILLHGAPGVGKTTTAEGVAERFQKPLFTITSGDLGTTAQEVDTELERHFALASRWGCILLIDEAEVFLAAREKKDIQRNGLVAVFLRVLEYYTGILFLTTNRVGEFDEAFASRINMSLYYPELDEHKTKKIFEVNLNLIRERYEQQGRRIDYDASSIEDFAERHFKKYSYCRWNGRQIRNLCQTALSLAEFDAQGGDMTEEVDRSRTVKLQLGHFITVQSAYVEFAFYMGEVRGTKGDRRAYDTGYRAKREDTPYYTPPSRLADRAEEMHRSRRQPNVMSASHQSMHSDHYESPTPSNWRPQGHHYQHSQYARPMGSSQQDYDFIDEPQRHPDPRLYGPGAHRDYLSHNTFEQQRDFPDVQFNQSPGVRPTQVSEQYHRRQPQTGRGDISSSSKMDTGPGADDPDDAFNPSGLRGGPAFGAGRGMGPPLR